jgi:DNA repair ATPase RecN
VAKGGELKEDDIKSLTAQTGVETLADSLDSGSVLDRLDRYNDAIDVAKQKTLDFLNTSQQEAKDTIDSNINEIEKLQAKRKELENVPGTSFEIETIDKQIAAYEKLNDKLQQIKDGLTLDEIDNATFSVIRDEIDAIVTKAETLKSAAEMIGEGFKIAADDVREFASLYPELLEQATYTADG